MVNYCCVNGCGRNSRSHGHLTFFTLPKEKSRQIAWLKAACPEVLDSNIEDGSLRSRRFCSRHFVSSHIKNQRLLPDAVPTLCLANSEDDFNQCMYDEKWLLHVGDIDCPEQHLGLACDGCGGFIVGFRYKCTQCKDFDLCQRCETHEMHPAHLMLRLPKPVDFETAKALSQRWSDLSLPKSVTGANDVAAKKLDSTNGDSSDDEPLLKKYVKRKNDEEWCLPASVKAKIRQEVARAIKAAKFIDNPSNASKANGNRSKAVAKKNNAKMTVKNVANARKDTNTEDIQMGVDDDDNVVEIPLVQATKLIDTNSNSAKVDNHGDAAGKNPADIEIGKETSIKYSMEEVQIEFASMEHDPSTNKSYEDKESMDTFPEIRQSAIDIAMNDTLSEFLIKRV